MATAPNFQQTMLEQLQELQNRQVASQQALATAQARKPRQGLLAEGQEGFGEIFSNTSDNQRSAMLNAGLSLMASDPTAQLSQRVAVAIQSGVNTLQKGREADIASDVATAQSAVDASGTEIDNMMKRFDLFKSGRELEQGDKRLDISEANLKVSQAAEERQAKGEFSDRFEVTLSGENEPTVLHYNPTTEQYMRDGVVLTPQQSRGMRIHERVPSVNMVDKTGKSLGLSFDDGKTLSDGTTVPEGALKMGKPTLTGSSDDIGVKLGQRADNKEVSENRDLAQGMEQNLHDIERMDELTSKLFTGPFGSGSIAKGISQIGAIGEEITGRDFGVQDVAADYEELATMTTEFGIRTLKLFGGNDTERELLTALRIQPSEDKLPKTNERLIKRKKAAFEVLSKKPEFQEKWRIENGGLDKADEGGRTFSQAWRQFQRNTFSGLDEPEREEETPVETDDLLINRWKTK